MSASKNDPTQKQIIVYLSWWSEPRYLHCYCTTSQQPFQNESICNITRQKTKQTMTNLRKVEEEQHQPDKSEERTVWRHLVTTRLCTYTKDQWSAASEHSINTYSLTTRKSSTNPFSPFVLWGRDCSVLELLRMARCCLNICQSTLSNCFTIRPPDTKLLNLRGKRRLCWKIVIHSYCKQTVFDNFKVHGVHWAGVFQVPHSMILRNREWRHCCSLNSKSVHRDSKVKQVMRQHDSCTYMYIYIYIHRHT